MNPLVVKELLESPQVQDGVKTVKRVRNGVLIGLGGILLIWGGYRIYRYVKKSKTSQSDEPDAVAAKKLFMALSPSGINSKWFPDGTNLTLLFNTAYEIINNKIDYSAVQKRYKDLTGRELDGDLHADLSPSDYDRFVNIVQNPLYDPNQDENNVDFYKDKFVYSDESFGLRKKYNDLTPYKVIPAGSCISNARSTGRSESFVGNVGTRIEMKTSDNVVFWVSKADTQLFASLDDMPKNKRKFKVLK